jgi:hypothetical protein
MNTRNVVRNVILSAAELPIIPAFIITLVLFAPIEFSITYLINSLGINLSPMSVLKLDIILFIVLMSIIIMLIQKSRN